MSDYFYSCIDSLTEFFLEISDLVGEQSLVFFGEALCMFVVEHRDSLSLEDRELLRCLSLSIVHARSIEANCEKKKEP